MTRRKPFYESNDFQTTRKVMGGILPTRPRGNPEQDVDQIDDAMWNLMKSCWAKEPEDRPTCTQILQRPELAGFKNERREEDGDRAAHEQWRFQHAMSQGTEAEINMASVEKILNEVCVLECIQHFQLLTHPSCCSSSMISLHSLGCTDLLLLFCSHAFCISSVVRDDV